MRQTVVVISKSGPGFMLVMPQNYCFPIKAPEKIGSVLACHASALGRAAEVQRGMRKRIYRSFVGKHAGPLQTAATCCGPCRR